MSGLKGKKFNDSQQQTLFTKKHWQEVERVAESEVVPDRHVFVSIFCREIEEKVENYSQSWYCSFTITYLKIISETKMNFGNMPEGGGARG